MLIYGSVISGFMVGIEFDWDEGVMVLDLGIFRVMVIKGSPPDESE